MLRSRKAHLDCRGSAITEFAIIAPVMILLIAGSIEIGRIAMIKSSLEAAIGTAARRALVDLKTPEKEREGKMIATITEMLSPYKPYPGRAIEIETKVYQDFGSSYPEGYEDLNGNGVYDAPTNQSPGEVFDDRNRNGKRDIATQLEGVLGAEGDVVAYTARMPIKLAFEFLPFPGNDGQPIILSSTVVLRNEPVAR